MAVFRLNELNDRYVGPLERNFKIEDFDIIIEELFDKVSESVGIPNLKYKRRFNHFNSLYNYWDIQYCSTNFEDYIGELKNPVFNFNPQVCISIKGKARTDEDAKQSKFVLDATIYWTGYRHIDTRIATAKYDTASSNGSWDYSLI